jgi:hypothetical protein
MSKSIGKNKTNITKTTKKYYNNYSEWIKFFFVKKNTYLIYMINIFFNKLYIYIL